MKRSLMALMIPLALILLTGCDATELGRRAIIQAAAVNYADGEYTVSALMFSSGGGSGEIDASDENVIKVTGSGPTFAAALDDISLTDGKDIFFSENKLLIIGGGFSENELTPALEVMTRELRCSLGMLVCSSDDPELLTDLHFTEGITSAEKPVSMIENAYRSGNSPKTCLLDLMNGTAAGKTVLIPQFAYTENGYGMTSDENGATAVLCGSREFSAGRLGRRLDMTETAGAMLLSGETDRVQLSFFHGGKEVGCEAYNVRIKQLEDGDISISANLRRRNGETLPEELKSAAMEELHYLISAAVDAK